MISIYLNRFFLIKYFSNNMLYPKEDKENRILLYAVNNSLPSLTSNTLFI
jgi:hypothetical protein